jgi:hypothetical protein
MISCPLHSNADRLRACQSVENELHHFASSPGCEGVLCAVPTIGAGGGVKVITSSLGRVLDDSSLAGFAGTHRMAR